MPELENPEVTPEVIPDKHELERTFTKAEVDEIQRLTRGNSFSDGKRQSRKPFLDILRKTPGFEDVADLDEAVFTDVARLAGDRKKSAKLDEEKERTVKQAIEAKDRAESRYRNSRIDTALMGVTSKANNPKQVAQLLKSEYRIELSDDDGRETIHILDSNGEVLRKDTYTPLTLQDLADKFLADNPHFIPGSAKASTEAKSRTGTPGTNISDTELAAKPIHLQTPEEKVRFNVLFKAGKIDAMAGKLIG